MLIFIDSQPPYPHFPFNGKYTCLELLTNRWSVGHLHRLICRPQALRDFLLCWIKSGPSETMGRPQPFSRWILFTKDITHWGRVKHIFDSKLTSIGSDNGLSPGRRQAVIWTIPGLLLIGKVGTSFSGILIEIHTFSFKKMHLKMSSGKWWPFCFGLNMIIIFPFHYISTLKSFITALWETTMSFSCEFT